MPAPARAASWATASAFSAALSLAPPSMTIPAIAMSATESAASIRVIEPRSASCRPARAGRPGPCTRARHGRPGRLIRDPQGSGSSVPLSDNAGFGVTIPVTFDALFGLALFGLALFTPALFTPALFTPALTGPGRDPAAT